MRAKPFVYLFIAGTISLFFQGVVLAETQNVPATTAAAATPAAPEAESMGTQAGKKAAELQKKADESLGAVNEQVKKGTEELTKTSQESLQVLKKEADKRITELAALWNDLMQNLNRQITDFKAQLQKKP